MLTRRIFLLYNNIISCAGNVEISPIPLDLILQNAVLIRDLLGYVPRVAYSPDAKTLMAGYTFSDDSSDQLYVLGYVPS